MPLKRTRLVRLGAVHAVGLAALAFATPAYATDDPPLPVPAAASPVLTFEEQDDRELGVASVDEAQISREDQESPGNMPPSASATAQLESVRQGWSQVISPPHAQKSPERASTSESQRSAASAPSYKRQYHPRHVQYQRVSTVRSKPRALVLPTASFSSGELSGITRTSSPIGSPNRSRNESENCSSILDENWSPDFAPDAGEGVECAPDPPSDEAAAPFDETMSVDSQDSTDCAEAEPQYQPDEPQYQTPASTTCVASDDSVVPISEPDASVPSTSESSVNPGPTSVVSPTTTETVAAPVAPSREPTQSGADVHPAPVSPRPTPTKVEANRLVGRPSRPRPASSEQRPITARVIPARARSASPSLPMRPRPVRAPTTKPTTSVSRGKVEAAAPQRLEPASSHVNFFGDWLLLVLPLSLVVALGLVFPAAAIAGRSLRARVASKGLSDRPAGTNRSRGIRYRD
jgi:hypothetical protein